MLDRRITKMNIEKLIRESLNLPVSDDLSIYKEVESREYYCPKICEIVNENIPKIDHSYDENILNKIENEGYAVVENFLSNDEIKEIVKYLDNLKGYQFHVPNRAYNKTPEKFTDNLNWNICSYKMNHLMHNPTILKLVTRPDIVALAQEYIGCLPTITSVSAWWSKFTGETFHTQNMHRDYDDFRFLAFFIYLSDVDEDNGPHVYYANTHKGSNDMSNKKVITGKAGTAIFGDTYALHYGQPLNSGKRLLFWSRYTMHKNNNFYRDKCDEYMQEPNMFFDIIDDNAVNRHLLSAFTIENDEDS